MASFVSHSLRTTRLLPKLSGVARTSTRFQQTLSAYEESLFNQPDTEVTRLGSGLRVASEESAGSTCSVGVWLEAGSRFENAQNNGVAHFIEHMSFKGTHNRSQSALENEVESMGAQLSAFTSREMTAFHARCFKKDLPQMVEILADVVQNPLLDEQAIENERSVILSDLKELNDTDQEAVTMDYLHKTAYQGTSLAQSIYGPTKNIKSLGRKDMQDYMSAHYSAPRMVIAAAGAVQHGDLVRLAEKNFSDLRTTYLETDIVKPVRFTGSSVDHRIDELPACGIAAAVESCGWAHPDALAMLMAGTICGSYDSSISGGHHLAGPVVQAVTEDKLCHNYHNFNMSYTDVSLWGSYALCDKDTVEDWIFALQQEWMRVCTSLTENEVNRARNLLKTNLLRELDGSAAICADIGRQLLAYDRRIPVAEMNKRLDAIDNTKIKIVAEKYIYDKCLAVGAYGATEQMPDYNRMRSSMYWLRL